MPGPRLLWETVSPMEISFQDLVVCGSSIGVGLSSVSEAVVRISSETDTSTTGNCTKEQADRFVSQSSSYMHINLICVGLD